MGEPCQPPEYGSLRYELEWDEGNLGHLERITKLTRGQIESGLEAGYHFVDDDPKDCRYRFLFQPVPPLLATPHEGVPVHRVIIDTRRGTNRVVTVMRETKASYIAQYQEAKRKGDLE